MGSSERGWVGREEPLGAEMLGQLRGDLWWPELGGWEEVAATSLVQLGQTTLGSTAWPGQTAV